MPQRLLTTLKVLLRRKRLSRALVLHSRKYTLRLTAPTLMNILCRQKRDRFSKPENLAILLVNNRSDQTALETSLLYLGVRDYVVVKPLVPNGAWKQSIKVGEALNFARKCAEEYILYADSDDAVILGDPGKAVDLLVQSGGQALFSVTSFPENRGRHDLNGWFRQLADRSGWSHSDAIYLNSGVFVARREFLVSFLETASEYVADDSLLFNKGASLREVSEKFDNDQVIYQILYPRFSDDLRLDYAEELALR